MLSNNNVSICCVCLLYAWIRYLSLLFQGLPGEDGERGPQGPKGEAVSISWKLLSENANPNLTVFFRHSRNMSYKQT